MTSYPPRRQVFSHRAVPGSGTGGSSSVGGSSSSHSGRRRTNTTERIGEDEDYHPSSHAVSSSAENDGNSVSSVNTDRASNHNVNREAAAKESPAAIQQPKAGPANPPPPSASSMPVPTTVVAAVGGGGPEITEALAAPASPLKLTAAALEKMQAKTEGSAGPYGMVEVSSNLSRSSSESGYLKNVNKGVPASSSSVDPKSGAATPAHFVPFEDVSSLGSLAEAAEDALLPTAIIESSKKERGEAPGMRRVGSRASLGSQGSGSPLRKSGKRDLTEMATAAVPPSLSAETPPSKDNLSSAQSIHRVPELVLNDGGGMLSATIPAELGKLNRAITPTRADPLNREHSFSDRLLPMGTGTAPAPRVKVDSALASIRPPPAPPLHRGHGVPSPYPSPKPPSAIRVTNSSHSPNIHRLASGNGKKATFHEGAQLTRTSSGGSSGTNNTGTGSLQRIRLGVCAMDKKARSKPMQEILKRLDVATFESVFFGDDMILNDPVENWPVCDVLIAFYSNGYPLEKAEQYVALRQPFLLNDLKMQRTLMDRRRVYDLLEESGIDVPRHVFMSRDGYVSTGTGDGPKRDKTRSSTGYGGCADEEPEIDEHDDHIEVNGVVINKPFVEKPVDADDHNIAIYYPSSAGGGCKKLFRKVGDRSSEFYPEINDIRRDGSYIYEEFIETQGTDVKMYTVGPDYGHAEARKSPAVDGKVERNPDGKEVRFPVILTLREKEIARRIVLVFKQQVCGFDILRIQEDDSLISYVCDVNGWSFVKNSKKYYDDCAQILTEHMLAALKPRCNVSFSALAPLLATMEDPIEDFGTPKKKKKRHHRGHSIADRVKMMLMRDNTEEEEEEATGDENDKVTDLQGSEHSSSDPCTPGLQGETYEEPVDFTTNPVRNIPDQLATEPASSASIVPSGSSSLADADDISLTREGIVSATNTHQEELRCVITIVRHGDRTPKQKLKGVMHDEHFLRYFHNHTKKVKKDLKVKAKKDMVQFLETVKAVIRDLEAEGVEKNRAKLYKARHIRDILTRWKFSGLNRKLQMKPRKWAEEETADGDIATVCSELQLIVKWGGDLTKLGEKQAIRLGNRLRDELYPSNKDGGILRLHSTFRHDLKIKTSDEGRVMKTAASFAKGMLELEGDIPPILVSLVHKEKDSRHMLDPSGNKEVKKDLDKCKEQINANMNRDVDYSAMTVEECESLVGPVRLASLHRALQEIGNPRKTLVNIHSTIGKLVEQLDEMLGELLSGDEEVIEGGAGLKAKEGHETLSGIKLYKGETLLELTERWKLLQNKLYDDESDTFDLSRVPDVHDNVRFDMLHNPHLGLTETLQKLYDLAKSMADCVVPQEYGITIEEKRDIGSKMCHTLLEKITYDLEVARTDNQVDMRYLINMDYSADLPINSMGRRVRSRLYFTSESHLHSMLNVLRFPSIVPSPLSLKGQEILANASELCYLTQVVIRLFEDTQKPSDDPKRFRVEILFSPGATATPLHMAELYRENDATRFDTEELQKISIDGLTCSQVEEYLAEAIKEGQVDDDDEELDKSVRTGVASKNDVGPIEAQPDASSSEENGEKANGHVANSKDSEEVDGETKNGADDRKGLDDDSDVEGPNKASRFSRPAAAVGVVVGAGCLYALSRVMKGVFKSGR